MITERLVARQVRKAVTFQNHGSRLGGIGGVVSVPVDVRGALDGLMGREICVRRGQAGWSFEDRTNSVAQDLGLRQEGVDVVLPVIVGKLAAGEEIIGTQQASKVANVDVEEVHQAARTRLTTWGQSGIRRWT